MGTLLFMYTQLQVGAEASYGVAGSRLPEDPGKAEPLGFLYPLAPYLA